MQITSQTMYPNFIFCKHSHCNYMVELLHVSFGVRELWLKIQVNSLLTTCVTLNDTFDLSSPKVAEKGARLQNQPHCHHCPQHGRKVAGETQRRKRAQLRLITFPSGIIPVFQLEMSWRFFERQTWRENVITFPCTWISRRCPFKIKKALEGSKGGGRERNEGWRRIIRAEACDISPKWLPLGAAGANVIQLRQ